MIIDRFQGDPKLFLTANGADLSVSGGQPLMDKGIENHVQISLFTREGWAGNNYLKQNEKMGSSFEKDSSGVIRARTTNDVRQSCINALKNPAFGESECTVTNPESNTLVVTYVVRPKSNDPQVFIFEKNGANWREQFLKGESTG
jgi:hypothetical protein